MIITRIEVFTYDLHYVHGNYTMSADRTVAELSSTVVKLATDAGIVGWGEVCPLGPTYLPFFAGGVRAALREVAPALLGLDPCNIGLINERMDSTLRGHGYAKSPIDIACWDVLGKVTGLSVSTLLGGQRQKSYPLYIAVPLGPADEMAGYVRARRAEGIHRFQLKVGGDPYADRDRVKQVLNVTGDEDIVIVDANGGWSLQDAMIVARLIDSFPRVYLEQPCVTLEECAYVRQHTALPMILDEIITDPNSLLRAFHARAMEAINLKISKVGGLTRAKLMRDLSEDLGLRVTIEDTWGGDLATAAISHLAASTRAQALFTVSFMNDWVKEHIAGYEPRSHNGVGFVSNGPGLGVQVDTALLGEPVFTFAQ
jgi:L-alanine-DL-glutamate epimerase-like enolase superfamily enzyme